MVRARNPYSNNYSDHYQRHMVSSSSSHKPTQLSPQSYPIHHITIGRLRSEYSGGLVVKTFYRFAKFCDFNTDNMRDVDSKLLETKPFSAELQSLNCIVSESYHSTPSSPLAGFVQSNSHVLCVCVIMGLSACKYFFIQRTI